MLTSFRRFHGAKDQRGPPEGNPGVRCRDYRVWNGRYPLVVPAGRRDHFISRRLTTGICDGGAAAISDLGKIQGFTAIQDYQFAARRFRSDVDPAVRLTVIMANHLPLEEQTGADLFYRKADQRSHPARQDGNPGSQRLHREKRTDASPG